MQPLKSSYFRGFLLDKIFRIWVSLLFRTNISCAFFLKLLQLLIILQILFSRYFFSAKKYPKSSWFLKVIFAQEAGAKPRLKLKQMRKTPRFLNFTAITARNQFSEKHFSKIKQFIHKIHYSSNFTFSSISNLTLWEEIMKDAGSLGNPR